MWGKKRQEVIPDSFRVKRQKRTGQQKKRCKVGFQIKKLGGGSLESKPCDICKRIKSNHYCRFELEGSKICIEGEDKEICGKVACFMCKQEWGDPEDFENRCQVHSEM